MLIYCCCEWRIKISAFAALFLLSLLLSCCDLYDRFDDVLSLELVLYLLAYREEGLLHTLTSLCTYFMKEYFAVGS